MIDLTAIFVLFNNKCYIFHTIFSNLDIGFFRMIKNKKRKSYFMNNILKIRIKNVKPLKAIKKRNHF